MEKAILANIPDCLRAKSQAQSSAWPQLPALWATWRPGEADQPKELAWRAEKARRGNLKIEVRSCRGLREKGSKQELLELQTPFLIYELSSTLNKGIILSQTSIQFSTLGRSDLSAAHLLLIFLFYQGFGVVLIYFLFPSILALSLLVYELINTLFLDLQVHRHFIPRASSL